jgi:ribulose-5-phosphate 4-epimerase/fuculose-1-phosphate aldolase
MSVDMPGDLHAETAVTAEPELVERVALACRVLGKLDATHGSFGHVSVRTGPNSMLIKGKGPGEVSLRHTTASDVVAVSFDVRKLGGRDDLRPPSESFLHAWIYRLRPEVESVIHMHPESALLLTVCGIGIAPIYGAYGQGALLATEGVPTYGSSLRISNHDRGQAFAQFMGHHRACLMRGHGVTTAGTSIEDAAVTTMALKELTDVTYGAYLTGREPAPLPEDELAEIARPPGPDRPFGSSGGQTGVLATWSNYQRLAEES